ncbi:MAG: (Na+)-NQR maturation NqrM [Porticoccaceae bacterium]
MGKKPISGSCGGVAAALGEDDYTCEICGDDPNKCDEISNTAKPLYTNAADMKNKE